MNRARIALAVFLMLIAGPALAQRSAAVRAVEHPEYSRLVLPVAPGASWVVARDGQSATVRLSGADQAYDLSTVFERMPRTRILSVGSRRTGGGVALDLTLACACSVTVQRLGGRLLAVDVRRGSPAPGGAPQILGAGGSAGSAAEDAAAGDATTGPAPPDPKTEQMAEREAGAAAGPANAAPQGMPAADDPVLLARESLLQQLSRAAEEGLLTLDPSADTSVSAPESPTVPGEAGYRAGPGVEAPVGINTPSPLRAPQAAPPGAAALAGLTPHLAVRSAADRTPKGEAAAAPKPPPCIGDGELDIAGWGIGTSDPLTEIGALRRAIIDETGAVAPEAVDRLARVYVSIGFGREAAGLLERAGGDVPARALLSDVANLIEGRPARPAGPIAGAEDCSGRVQLWRAVGGLERFDPASERGQQIIADLAGIPPRLRRLVGQEVARQALRGGAPEAARAVFDLLERTPEPSAADENQIRAEMALATGAAGDAAALTGAMISASPSPDPDLWLLRARAVLADGMAVPPDLPDNLAIAGRPLKGTILGLDLALARARLEARSGAARSAIAQLGAARGGWPGAGSRIRRVARDILLELDPGAIAPSAVAQVVLGGEFALTNDAESQAIRLKYARALTERGLPNLALRMVRPRPVLPDAESRLISAAAQLASGAPQAAIADLGELAGPEAARLRVEAFTRQGAIASAYVAAAGLAADDPRRARLALLSGNWGETAGSGLEERYRGLGLYLAGIDAGVAAPESAGAAGAAPDAAVAAPALTAPRNRTMQEARTALREAERLREALPRADGSGTGARALN